MNSDEFITQLEEFLAKNRFVLSSLENNILNRFIQDIKKHNFEPAKSGLANERKKAQLNKVLSDDVIRKLLAAVERMEKEELETLTRNIRIVIRSPRPNSIHKIGRCIYNLLAEVEVPKNIRVDLKNYIFKWLLVAPLKNGKQWQWVIHEQLSGKSLKYIHPDFEPTDDATLIVRIEDRAGNLVKESDPVTIVLEEGVKKVEIEPPAKNEFFTDERIDLKAFVNLGFTEFGYVWYISEFGDVKKVKHRYEDRSTDLEVPYNLPASELGVGKFEVYFGVIIDLRLPEGQRVKWSQPVVITVKERATPAETSETGRETSQPKDEFDAGVSGILDKFDKLLGGKD